MEGKYEPISMWGYFWLQILYAIPVVGFIFLIIHSFNEDNINRRNFARSYFCVVIIALVFIAISFAIALSQGALEGMIHVK